MDTIKSYILNLVAKIILATLIRAITNQIISWIQGNDGQNVGFVGNLDQQFRQSTDSAGGAFLNTLAGMDLCTANLKQFLQISLRSPGIRQHLDCTLSDIGANAENFFRDFQQGGWPAFIKIGLEPQNNPYGAYLIALDAKVAAEDAAGRTLAAKFSAGKGFLGFNVKKEKSCTSISADRYQEIKDTNSGTEGKAWRAKVVDTAPEEAPSYQLCNLEDEIKTPGNLVADSLSKAVGSGIDFAVASQEIDGAITAVASALIQKIISSSAGVFSGGGGSNNEGVFNPEAGNLQFTISERQNSALQQRIGNVVFTADAALDALNQLLIATQQNLFATRRQIADLNAQIADLQKQSVSPTRDSQIAELQKQLIPLQQTAADLEVKLNTLLNQQARMLSDKADFTDTQQAFVSTDNPQELMRSANKLETAILQLSQTTSETQSQTARQGGNQTQQTKPVAIASGDIKQDTTTRLAGAEKNVRDEIALFQQMLDEIDRQLAIPAIAPDRKTSLTAQRAQISPEISRLNEQLTALLNLDTQLAAAITELQISVARQDAIARIVVSDRELQSANTIMTAAEPILKP